MKPLVLNGAPLDPAGRARIEAALGCEVRDIAPGDSPAMIDAADRGRVVGWLCTSRSPVNAAALALLPGLRAISTRAVGYDNIELAAVAARRIPIGYTPGVLDRAVADLAFGLMLCLSRNLLGNDRFVRSGDWRLGNAPLSRDLKGKQLGLLGLGRIGGELARLAHGYGMRVAYFQRHRDLELEAAGVVRYCERETLFRQSDFLSCHLPLTAATQKSVGVPEFRAMKPSAWFINTSRGAVVDEAALVAALEDGRIAGAGLDVMENEPLDPDNALCRLPNVILQPNSGSGTVETRAAMMDLAIDNLIAGVQGRVMPAQLRTEPTPS
jgi:glyoxylate reductase